MAPAILKILLHRLQRRTSVFASIAIAYVVWYVQCACRPIRLLVPEGLRRIVSSCPSLQGSYAPTVFAPTWHGQMFLLVFHELLVWLQPSPFSRELLTLRDSQVMAVDWLEPAPPLPAEACKLPVAVLLHGAFHISGSRSSPMIALARCLVGIGCPVVVPNRRGYGAPMTQPRFSFYGDDEDLDEVLLRSVATRYPGRSISVIGFSAGSGFAFRYVGRLTTKDGPAPAGLPHCACCVVWDGDPDLNDQCMPQAIKDRSVDAVLGTLMYTRYYLMNRNVLGKTPSRAQLLEQLSPTSREGRKALSSVQQTHGVLRKLSKDFKGSQDYLRRQSFAQYLLSSSLPPTILLNSADDPICVQGLIESNHRKAAERNPCIALAEFARGAHGPKFDALGLGSKIPRIISEFVAAVAREDSTCKPASRTSL